MMIAGYFAKEILSKAGIGGVRAYIKSIGKVKAKDLSVEEVFSSKLCPDEEAFQKMLEEMERARNEGDSVGGALWRLLL